MIKSMDGCQGTFDVHPGTAEKSIDKIDPVEMSKCAAAMAVMSYVLADAPKAVVDGMR